MVSPAFSRSVWLDTVDPAPAREPAPLPARVDVAIVGAGFTGLAAALASAKRGATVAVLERQRIAWGATSRNAGMALTGLKLPVESLIAKCGPERARSLFASSVAAIACVERIVREESIDCDFVRCGHLEAACKRSHFESLRHTARLLTSTFGHAVTIVERGDLAAELGSDVYHGGLVDEASAGVNPVRLARGLASAAIRRGALIAEATGVDTIERSSSGVANEFQLSTARGMLRADRVLIATGAYTGRITPALGRGVIPIGSYVIATERLGASAASALIPRGRMIFDSNNILHYYRRTPDDRLLFGGRAAFVPDEERTIAKSASILRDGMVRVFPQLRDAAIDYAWGGTIDATFDLLPHAGEVDGMHYAMGFAGHGVAMATYLGTEIAAVIAGEQRELLASGPIPSAPFGMDGAVRRLLPLAGAWYRFQDWAS